MASSQYFLQVEDADVASVDVGSSVVTAKDKLESTTIFLRDKNVDVKSDSGEVKSPSADFFVVEPDHVSIDIDPYKSWIVLVGNK